MSIVHERDASGRYLVNTGIEILGAITKLDSSVYRGCLGNIVKRINIQDMIDPYITLSMYKISKYFLCLINRDSLHPPHHYCILIITILRGNRLMYQLYHNTSFIRNSTSSWYLAYEEVIPADTCLPPAASVSFGLSTLNINGVVTIN